MRYQPSPTTADFVKGRFSRFRRRSAMLERFDRQGWIPIARFGSSGDANEALDEAVGSGEQAARLRVVERGASLATRIAMVVGALTATAIIAFFVYVLFGS